MRLLALALFFIASTLSVAWTDYYVDSAASGGGDGSSGSPWTWAEMITNLTGTATSPKRVNVKGTFALASFSDLRGCVGTSTYPIWIRGYTTAPGDGGLATINSSSTTLPAIGIGDFMTLDGFVVNGNITREIILASDSSLTTRCIINNSSTNSGASCVALGRLTYSKLLCSGGSSAIIADNLTSCLYNFFSCSSASKAVELETTLDVPIIGNVFCGGGSGIAVSLPAHRTTVIVGNRFYNYATFINLSVSSVIACVISDNIGYTATNGINLTSTTDIGHLVLQRNAFGNCTAGLYVGFAGTSPDIDNPPNIDSITLTADPFTDAANGDLSLNNTAGGGALLRAAGFAINMPYDWTNMEDEATYEGSSSSGGVSLSRIFGGL